MQIPLYRMAFPDTPWLFLHRDPVEILASHQVAPSPEMMPEILPPATFGLEEQSRDSGDYQARVLARIAEAAIAALHAGGGISVDYQSLPEAVFTTILPQFRESARPEERRAMEHATSDHAKHPGRRFEADSASKAQSLGAERRAAAQRRLAPLHAQLRALSLPPLPCRRVHAIAARTCFDPG